MIGQNILEICLFSGKKVVNFFLLISFCQSFFTWKYYFSMQIHSLYKQSIHFFSEKHYLLLKLMCN